MKIHCLISMCMAVLLPCTLGDYICTFPDYLSGNLYTEYSKTPFYASVKDGLFESMYDNGGEVIDLKNKKRYINLRPETCSVFDFNTSGFYYSYGIPIGVSTGASGCDGFTSAKPNVQCFIKYGVNVHWRYTVKMTEGGTCMPINIRTYSGHRSDVPPQYEIKDIHVDETRDPSFYTAALRNDEFPCDLSKIVVS